MRRQNCIMVSQPPTPFGKVLSGTLAVPDETALYQWLRARGVVADCLDGQMSQSRALIELRKIFFTERGSDT